MKAFDETASGHLPKAFRATIPVVCPNVDVCRAKSEVSETYVTPLLSVELKDIAARLGAPQ